MSSNYSPEQSYETVNFQTSKSPASDTRISESSLSPRSIFEEELEVALSMLRTTVLATFQQQLAATQGCEPPRPHAHTLKFDDNAKLSSHGTAELRPGLQPEPPHADRPAAPLGDGDDVSPEADEFDEVLFSASDALTIRFPHPLASPTKSLDASACDSGKTTQPSSKLARGRTGTRELQSGSSANSKFSLNERMKNVSSLSSRESLKMPAAGRELLLEAIKRANTGRATSTFEDHDASDIMSCSILDTASAAAIILNIICMAVSLDVYSDSKIWIVVDGGFAVFFFAEIMYKLFHVQCLDFFCGREARWNTFEIVLVALAVFEVIIASSASGSGGGVAESGGLFVVLRMLRLARIARIARLARLKYFGELLMMINGAVGGFRTLLWSIVLIAIPQFALALILRETLGTAEDNFRTFPRSFLTVFRCLIAADCTDKDGKPLFLLATLEHGWIYGVIYCSSVVLMTFGLFNIIVAIYVENTIAAAKFNDIAMKRLRLMDEQMFTEKTMDLVEFIWRTGIGAGELDNLDFDAATQIEITPEFFEELRSYREFQDLLRGLDIADEDQLDLFDTLDVDGGGTIDVDELVRGISKLRGDARRSDIIGVSLMVRSMQTGLAELSDAVGTLQHGMANITSMPSRNSVTQSARVSRRFHPSRYRKSNTVTFPQGRSSSAVFSTSY